MDCKMLTNILEKSKKKLAIENEIFIRAINQRKNDEISFQNSIKRLQKMPDTAIDIFDLHTELGDNKNDDQLKDNKMDVNVLKQNLDKEFNNSRKRLVQMENFAVSIKRSFGIEPSNIVEVYDSPPRTEASEGKGMKIISYEVCYSDLYKFIKNDNSFDFYLNL